MVRYCLIQDRPVYFISFNWRPNLQYSLSFEDFLFTFHTPCNECAALTYEYGSGRVVKTVYPQTPICYPRRRLRRNVRPTSQRRAVSPAAVFCSPDCRWRRRLSRFFARRHIFSSTFSFSDITTTIALCMIYRSADSAMTSSLLHDTAYLSVSWLESLCGLFLHVVQSQALEEHDTLGNTQYNAQYTEYRQCIQ